MLAEKKHIFIICDECGQPALDGDGAVHLLDFDVSDRRIDMERRGLVDCDDWTENGEGKIHCPTCPPLTLTDEAKDERARERERTGPTLFDLEGPES